MSTFCRGFNFVSTFCRGFNGSWWTDEELQWRDTAGNLVTWDFTNNQTTGKQHYKITVDDDDDVHDHDEDAWFKKFQSILVFSARLV